MLLKFMDPQPNQGVRRGRGRPPHDRNRKWGAALLLVLGAVACPAQSGGDGQVHMLVSTEWLANRLGDESLVVLHVGSHQDYDKGHIPGARLLTLTDISITSERGLRLELPPLAALQEAFARVGVSSDSRIIIYPGTDSVQSATRIWFTLDYVGLGGRASLLDGGFGLWRAENRPVSTEAPRIERTQLAVRARPELVVDAGWVRSHLQDPGVALLDARTPEFFTGANAGGMPRAGRIPGARSIPFTSVFDPNRKLKSAESIRELLGSPNPGRRRVMVPYCHIGQQATVLYFVSRYLGLEARLYDGSFQDWSGRLELPVEPRSEGDRPPR
jgi:thiosulfate/3-mercaptopyruvate sulfurtransferase